MDACVAGPQEPINKWFLIYMRIKRWVYLYIWCRYCYARVSRLLHRFNLHYAPPNQLSTEIGRQDHWCKWCGLRGQTYSAEAVIFSKKNGSK
jgi:hypothetical protein